MCNGDADGEELPQVTTSHHQVNDYKRRKPDDISQWKWNCNPEAMVIIAKKGKEYNPKSREVQMQPSITKNPSAELKIQKSTKKDTKADRNTTNTSSSYFQDFYFTFPFPYLWADWERGLEVCSRRIAPDDLIIKSCYFQLQQLLYSFNHSSYPMFLATSINKLQYSPWNLG